MNFRLSIALVAVLVLVAGYFFFIELRKAPPAGPTPTWFYNTDDSNFQTIAISYQGQTETFAKDSQSQWHFNTPTGELVDVNRWGGITLLLKGPQSRRILLDAVNPADLPGYGLDKPATTVAVTMTDGNTFRIFIGEKTPDAVSHYVMMEGYSQLFLIDATWGDVLDRLVTELPHIPTPTPAASPAPAQ